ASDSPRTSRLRPHRRCLEPPASNGATRCRFSVPLPPSDAARPPLRPVVNRSCRRSGAYECPRSSLEGASSQRRRQDSAGSATRSAQGTNDRKSPTHIRGREGFLEARTSAEISGGLG